MFSIYTNRMGIASSDKNTIRKMSEIEAVIYDRFLSIKCPDEKVNKIKNYQVDTLVGFQNDATNFFLK